MSEGNLGGEPCVAGLAYPLPWGAVHAMPLTTTCRAFLSLIHRGAKWLLLSTEDVALKSICCPRPADGVRAIAAAYCAAPAQLGSHRPAPATELVLSSAHHLHALLGVLDADHMLCVEPEAAAVEPADLVAPGTPPCMEAVAPAADEAAPAAAPPADDQALHLASMAWAYRARALAQHPCKVSLVSRGQRHVPGWPSNGPAGSTASLALGVAKAQYMEDRGACGVSLDLPGRAKRRLTTAQLQWLLCDSGEYACALRGGQLYAERLVPRPGLPRPRRLVPHPGMASLVAGGTKGLGLQYGQQLVARGCRTLVLTSRSGLLSKEQLVELAQQGGWGRTWKKGGGMVAGSFFPWCLLSPTPLHSLSPARRRGGAGGAPQRRQPHP